MFRRTKGKEGQRMRRLTRIVLLGFTIFLALTFQAQAVITDVDIVPEMPATTDIITIFTYGMDSGGPVIDDVNYVKVGNSLQLDFYITYGFYLSITRWSHPVIIESLPVGIYELQVSEYLRHPGEAYVFVNTYPITFEVVPEPGTLLLFSGGFLAIRSFSKKKVTS